MPNLESIGWPSRSGRSARAARAPSDNDPRRDRLWLRVRRAGTSALSSCGGSMQPEEVVDGAGHCPFAFHLFSKSPRRNCRKPLACLMCPNTGSTICLHSRNRLRRPVRWMVSAIQPGVSSPPRSAPCSAARPPRRRLPPIRLVPGATQSASDCKAGLAHSHGCPSGASGSGLLASQPQRLSPARRDNLHCHDS